MKAWVLHGAGNLRWETLDVPVPGGGEVLVAVKAAGVCGSDVPRIFETGAHRHPIIPGHEFSGVIEAVGPDVEPSWLYKRVSVFPLLPCGSCAPCKAGRYELCRSYGYLGSRQNGAFAEYVTVPAWNLAELPQGASFEEAAMLEPMTVAVHAARIGTDGFTLDKDAAVAVCGLGAVGLLLIMFLLEAGYQNIYAIGNKDAQKQRVTAAGVLPNHYLDSRKTDGAAHLQECAGGAALFFECTGRNEAAAMGINGAGPMGKVVFVGNPCSDMAFRKDTYWKILRNQLTIAGTWNASFKGGVADDWSYALERLKMRRIAPAALISHRFTLEELNEGLSVMQEKKQDFCKVMVVGREDGGWV